MPAWKVNSQFSFSVLRLVPFANLPTHRIPSCALSPADHKTSTLLPLQQHFLKNVIFVLGGINSGSRGVKGEKGEGEVVGIKKDCWELIVYC